MRKGTKRKASQKEEAIEKKAVTRTKRNRVLKPVSDPVYFEDKCNLIVIQLTGPFWIDTVDEDSVETDEETVDMVIPSETSHIVGFSDSEDDSEATESDEELNDYDEELVISSLPPPLNMSSPEVQSWAEMKMREIPKEYKSLWAPKYERNKCGT